MRISIERLAGVEFAGYYDVGKRVVAQVAGLSNILFVPLLPYVASHGARGEEARIRETLAMVYRLMLAGGIPTACFLFWFASPIFAAWIGPGDVSYPVLVCRVAMVYVCIELLTGPATTTAVGMGEPRISAAKLLLSIGLYAGVPVVGLLGGFEAMVLGEAAAVIAGSALSLALFQRQFGMGPGWIETRNAAAVLGLCAAVWAPVAILLLRYPLWWGWKSLATWGVSCLVGVCLTIVGSWVAGVLRSSEIRLVLGAVGFRG
jgi:O-antigen/teichoic acid export membrane protein